MSVMIRHINQMIISVCMLMQKTIRLDFLLAVIVEYYV